MFEYYFYYFQLHIIIYYYTKYFKKKLKMNTDTIPVKFISNNTFSD